MGFIVFKHSDDDEEIGAETILSLYSLPEYSLVKSYMHPVDFSHSRTIITSHCNGIYFFWDSLDKAVIIDLSTEVFKPLTLPPFETSENQPCHIHACGIGYDPTSNVYKIVVAYHFSEKNDCGFTVYRGYKNRACLYSVGADSWTPVQCLDAFRADSYGVYLGHESYWLAVTEFDEQHQDQPGVVLFDYRSSRFDQFRLPEELSVGGDYYHDLVKYDDDKLGVVRVNNPHKGQGGSIDCCIWVREGQSWECVHKFCIGRPVLSVSAVLKHERQMVFEEFEVGLDEGKPSKVHVVDVDNGELLRTLGIHGKYFNLLAFPYEKSKYEFQGGHPLIIKSNSDDEDEETGKKKKKKKSKRRKKSS